MRARAHTREACASAQVVEALRRRVASAAAANASVVRSGTIRSPDHRELHAVPIGDAAAAYDYAAWILAMQETVVEKMPEDTKVAGQQAAGRAAEAGGGTAGRRMIRHLHAFVHVHRVP